MKKRMSILIIGILLICAPIKITTLSQNININIPSDNNLNNSLKQSQLLIIERIEDGFGLTLTIKNIGDENVQNIVLNTEILEGPQFLFLRKHINISPLSPGESKKILIKPIGLSFGLLNPYPMITFSLHASDIIHFEWGIITRVIGPFIQIVGNYFNSPFSSEGFTLYSPEYSTKTYLIDNSCKIVHDWKSDHIQALGVYLLENGCILRTALSNLNPVFWAGGLGGRVEIIDWNNTLVWEFDYANDTVCLHHDVEVLPNGNILLIAWENKSREEAIAAGRNPSLLYNDQLWPDHVIEVKPIGYDQGEIVWEWHIWDHLIQDYDQTKENFGKVEEHPELIDINYVGIDNEGHADWVHTNSIDYNEEFDQILLSVHNFNEIWVIDHSTTSEEASGHSGGRYGMGGNLLYRWGNPITYKAGDQKDQKFFGQHDAQWIDEGYPGEGHILVFNNGWDPLNYTGREFSSIDEIVPPVNENGFYLQTPGSAFGPKEQIWVFTTQNPKDFFAGIISGCQRLPNGNTLICHGLGGIFFEVTMDKHIVWLYTNQFPDLFDNHVFKIRRYSPDYPGLKFLFD